MHSVASHSPNCIHRVRCQGCGSWRQKSALNICHCSHLELLSCAERSQLGSGRLAGISCLLPGHGLSKDGVVEASHLHPGICNQSSHSSSRAPNEGGVCMWAWCARTAAASPGTYMGGQHSSGSSADAPGKDLLADVAWQECQHTYNMLFPQAENHDSTSSTQACTMYICSRGPYLSSSSPAQVNVVTASKDWRSRADTGVSHGTRWPPTNLAMPPSSIRL